MGRKGKTLEGEVIESFYGVYLLVCDNPRYLGRTYIGFTVDPNRRIQQHNLGSHKGGARRTSNRGPWSMVLIIHGFPNEIAALRFEWAWQHPLSSRRLKHVSKKKPKESAFDYALRVVSEMLRVGPWCRLPLTIRWLLPDRCKEFSAGSVPPLHMALCYGPVVSKKIPKVKDRETDVAEDFSPTFCHICKKICCKEDTMKCLVKECSVPSHTLCLAEYFLKTETEQFVPLSGSCPECKTEVLWGDLVRKKKGCYSNLDEEQDVGSLSDYEIEVPF